MFALALVVLTLLLLFVLRAKPRRGARGLISGSPFDPFDPHGMR